MTRIVYGVKFSCLDFLDSGRLIMKNKSLMKLHNTSKDVLSFDSEEDANLFINEVNEKAIKYCEEYNLLIKTNGDKCDYKTIVKPFFDSIEGKIKYGTDSLYWNAFYGLYEEKITGKKQYKMEVVQLIKVE